MTHVILDTNVVLDALAVRVPFADDAQHLMLAVARDEIAGYITTNTVTDIYYLLCRHYTTKEEARAKMETLFSVVGILEISVDDCHAALHSPMDDFEDAVLACCAARNSIDFIATRNTKDFENSPVPQRLPAELLNFI